MKNVIKTIKKSLIIATMFASILGNATDVSLITIKEDVKKTALTINNVKKGNLLSIKDSNGIILYKELIKTTGTYKKGFDLAVLPDGSYSFVINKDLEINTIPFSVNSSKVLFNKEKETTIHKPYLKQENGIIYITKFAPNLKPLNITIYKKFNGDFELLHSEKVKDIQVIQKAYKLEKGNYKIVLNSDNNEYTEFINN
ncbi:hypothetical protein A8C32_10315 [Flavivirga aquatica]|uniref:Secretion system C-terminal sorting domain-containing protein n=1 Tax=Flavivirga aquatica TaxID=1849968 RepID=A0A1E5TEV7_9FLAO|nr:hypothetical protein [Flavivirga aquatica]OEK09894.1 hypothetical protein A8C32_10315 [Flavivirga aquatica]